MQQYHCNAKTNVNNREHIQNDNQSQLNLAARYSVSTNTINKWRHRNFTQDKSSRPNSIEYALTDTEKALAISIRTTSWIALGEIHEMLLVKNSTISQSAVYRCLKKEGINTVPQEKKDKAKKFKEYEPGYLHIDVTYLPKLEGQKRYLFVAIDRATRVMLYDIYEDKSANSTDDFMDKCIAFFPFNITHILTDNGLEFTNRLIKSKTGNLCKTPSKMDVKCSENNIEHRLTAPATPKTNGMVERVNGTIKNNTILKNTYTCPKEMKDDLTNFMVYYIFYRRHGSLRKELKVKTPFQALEKWFELKPELFIKSPNEFKNNSLFLSHKIVNFNTTTL